MQFWQCWKIFPVDLNRNQIIWNQHPLAEERGPQKSVGSLPAIISNSGWLSLGIYVYYQALFWKEKVKAIPCLSAHFSRGAALPQAKVHRRTADMYLAQSVWLQLAALFYLLDLQILKPHWEQSVGRGLFFQPVIWTFSHCVECPGNEKPFFNRELAFPLPSPKWGF